MLPMLMGRYMLTCLVGSPSWLCVLTYLEGSAKRPTNYA